MSRKAAAGVLALAMAGGGWFQLRFGRDVVEVPAYRVAKVVDGDTFDTDEKQIVRLASVLAPEVSQCAGEESKRQLEMLVKNQDVYIKVVYRDKYKRLVGLVYTKQGFVNERLIAGGYAYFGGGLDYGRMRQVMQEAKLNKLGVFSDKCVQATNPKNPKCNIKANVNPFHPLGRYYRFPGCGQYNQTMVQLSQGDSWFCSEREAEEAGFVKGADCFEKTF